MTCLLFPGSPNTEGEPNEQPTGCADPFQCLHYSSPIWKGRRTTQNRKPSKSAKLVQWDPHVPYRLLLQFLCLNRNAFPILFLFINLLFSFLLSVPFVLTFVPQTCLVFHIGQTCRMKPPFSHTRAPSSPLHTHSEGTARQKRGGKMSCSS